ncbi:MAG: oxidoreductase [Pseudomonadota bacterium]
MSENLMEPSLQAIIRSSTRITDESTDEVRELVISIDEPSFRYKEGQSIGVVVPGKDEFGCENHTRKYSIANGMQDSAEEGAEITIIVKRCFYIDDFSGEEYPGRASNYLCDAKVGDSITITGPYRNPFNMPTDKNANILMIGTGTGIAPFRSFIQSIYNQEGNWNGQIRLFYGAKTGLDLLYMNDVNDDISNYYQEATFKAYKALADRPLAGEEKGLENSLKSNLDEAWELMNQSNTYVFVSGLTKISSSLDLIMGHAAGSKEDWKTLKKNMIKEKRWSTLIYG